jgi:hypothetical protein
MKEDMYTYHYFQNRALKRPSRACDFIFHAALLSTTAYIVAMLVFLFK